jgi:pyruvate dehydrogenase E2 component (dihydrolipoamide acetyltransferase)
MAEIRMPKMGDGMEEGTILRWMKAEGDHITEGEPIAEIETDKANVEVPAAETGKLVKIVVHEGGTVPVGAVIAHVGEVSVSAAPQLPSETNGTAHSETKRQPAASVPEAAAATAESAARVKATPLARKLAAGMGIDIRQVVGTGPGGRIKESDVKAASAAAAAPGRSLAAALSSSPEGTEVEVGRMRRAIARRTLQSTQGAPHFYVTMAIVMDDAMDLLALLNEGAETRITVNDLIVKACAQALTVFPDVNVSWTPEDRIRRYSSVNIGVAVGTDDGLTIPVIPGCENKTLRRIAVEARALISKARAGQLVPAEMSGGTFSISNLGMLGVEEFTAIINPPEAAILAVGAITKEVAVDDEGEFYAEQRMRVTLSCDHRAVDGLLGAKFLAEVKRLLEHPHTLLA